LRLAARQECRVDLRKNFVQWQRDLEIIAIGLR
jgi:hypothetical protein